MTDELKDGRDRRQELSRNRAFHWSFAALLLCLTSCDALSQSLANLDLSDLGNIIGDGGLDPGGTCEPQSVVQVPSGGLVQVETRIGVASSGTDGGLGRVLGLVSLVEASLNDIPTQEAEYLVDDQGALIGQDGRFAVVDGCLGIQADDSDAATPENAQSFLDNVGAELLQLQSASRGNCPAGNVPIGVGGLGDTSTGHICVSTTTDSCLTCVEDINGWTQTATLTATYRASGNLTGVAAVDLVDGSLDSVTIREGESVVIRLTAESRYARP